MKDPETGEIYAMDQSQHNRARGSYVNPKRPTELLQHAAPGECASRTLDRRLG